MGLQLGSVTYLDQPNGDVRGTLKQLEHPGGPVVKAPHFHCRGRGFNPWLRN